MKTLLIFSAGIAAWLLVCAWIACSARRNYGLERWMVNQIAACFWLGGNLVGLGTICLAILLRGVD